MELFDVYGLDFIGPFLILYENCYILVAGYYVSKWVGPLHSQIINPRVFLNSWKGIFLPSLGHLMLAKVMGVLIFTTNHLVLCLPNMESSIKWLLDTIFKLVGWKIYPTKRYKIFWWKLGMWVEWIGLENLMMLCGA